jgi:hypothetical protein
MVSNPADGMDISLLCSLCVVWVAVCETDWSLVQRSATVRVRVRVCVCVIMSDLETSRMRRPGPDLGSCATEKYTAYLISPAHRYTWGQKRVNIAKFFIYNLFFLTVDDVRSPEFK